MNDPENFWYYNNGITILVESIKKKLVGGNTHETGIFVCTGIQIVNGAQTVGSIESASNKNIEAIEKAYVQVRIISLEAANDEELEKTIAKTNNTQTRIESRDFVSLDPLQQQIKDVLAVDGIDYVYRQGDIPIDRNKSFDFVEATLSRVYSAGNIEMLVTAKAQIGKLWANIEKEPYKILFNKSVEGLKIWLDVQILREIDSELLNIQSKNNGRSRLIAIHGNRAVAFSVFRKLDFSSISNFQLEPQHVSIIKELTNKVFVEILGKADTHYTDSYPANIFKNREKTKKILEAIGISDK